MTLADSLRRVITRQDSLLENAATRAINVSPPHITFTPPADSSSLSATLLGFFLAAGAGLLVLFLTRSLERRDLRKQVAQAVALELAVFQARMLSIGISLAGRCNRLDHDLLKTLRAAVPVRVVTEDLRTNASAIDHLLSLQDPQTAWQPPRPPGSPKTSMALKRYELTYLDSESPRIDLLKPETHSLLLQARGALGLFNQYVDDAMRYHWMTFDELADENHAAAQYNLESTYNYLLDTALRIMNFVALALGGRDFNQIKLVVTATDPSAADPLIGSVLASGEVRQELDRRRLREEASRFFLRPAEKIRTAFHGVELKIGNKSVFEMIGPVGLRHDIEALMAAVGELRVADARLLELHDDDLEKDIRKAVESAQHQGALLLESAAPFFPENLRPDKPWDRSLIQGFHMHTESIRAHFVPVWDQLIARLKAHQTAPASSSPEDPRSTA